MVFELIQTIDLTIVAAANAAMFVFGTVALRWPRSNSGDESELPHDQPTDQELIEKMRHHEAGLLGLIAGSYFGTVEGVNEMAHIRTMLEKHPTILNSAENFNHFLVNVEQAKQTTQVVVKKRIEKAVDQATALRRFTEGMDDSFRQAQ